MHDSLNSVEELHRLGCKENKAFKAACLTLKPQLLKPTRGETLVLKYNWEKIPFELEGEAFKPKRRRLGRYPTSVRIFLDPILFLVGLKPSWEYGQQRPAIMAGGKEMAFKNFIYTEDVEDLLFLPKEPSSGFSVGSPFVLLNTGPLKADEELVIRLAEVMADSRESLKPELFVVHHGSVAAQIKDMKLSDDDKDVTACRLKISAITPLAWKNHLDMHMDVELLNLHDHCYARQAVADNVVNKRAYEQVADMKEPFDLSKVKGYRSS
nr:hypothetical protein [Tanacetum cinerariifolium]